MWKDISLQPGTEVSIVCRVAARSYPSLGMIERNAEHIPVAASVNAPDAKGRVMVRCMNPSQQPHVLKAGCIIASNTSVEEPDVQAASAMDMAEDLVRPGTRTTTEMGVTESCAMVHMWEYMPEHLQVMAQKAEVNCKNYDQAVRLGELLTKY